MQQASHPMDNYIIDQCRCPVCGQTCLQKNIYRHMITLHQWSRDDCKSLIMEIRTEKKGLGKPSYVCSYCRVMFRTVRHLVQHRRLQICTAQPEIPDDEDEYLTEMIVEQEEIVGDYIDNDKPSTSNYQVVPPHRAPRAIQPHHIPTEEQKLMMQNILEKMIAESQSMRFLSTGGSRHRGTQTKCPECTSSVDNIEDLVGHCREKHSNEDTKFILEQKVFPTLLEFKKWFDKRQEDTCTSLTKRTGHGGETLYRCHRIGKYQSVAKARKSNPRKIDQTCTAFLKVTTRDEDGCTWATGCFTHIGHTLDHRLLWLTETQERYVRDLLDMSWTGEQIFNYITREYSDYPCKLKYLTKNDVRNITVRYNREKKATIERTLKDNTLGKEEPEVSAPKSPKKSPEIQADNEEVPERKLREPSTPPPALETPPTTTENGRNPDEEYINVVDDEPLPKLSRISED